MIGTSSKADTFVASGTRLMLAKAWCHLYADAQLEERQTGYDAG